MGNLNKKRKDKVWYMYQHYLVISSMVTISFSLVISATDVVTAICSCLSSTEFMTYIHQKQEKRDKCFQNTRSDPLNGADSWSFHYRIYKSEISTKTSYVWMLRIRQIPWCSSSFFFSMQKKKKPKENRRETRILGSMYSWRRHHYANKQLTA